MIMSVEIRGEVFDTPRAAADAFGVSVATIERARDAGTLDHVICRRNRVRPFGSKDPRPRRKS